MIRVFSSFTKAYLPKARVLAKTLKKYHPDWIFYAIFSDTLPPGFDLKKEPFTHLWTLDKLDIPDCKSWIFKHNIIELCTAVKGPALVKLLDIQNTDAVFYIDPDIVIYNNLNPLIEKLSKFSILLTPHLLHPEDEPNLIMGNEVISTLAHGVYNLGFIGVAGNSVGIKFAKWWKKRLLLFCYDDVSEGLFTDQRWCDLIPSFFDNYYIIRDPGYNVATWNLGYRKIKRNLDGTYYADKFPLRFYHFTGYDLGWNFTNILMKHARKNKEVLDLWKEYEDMLNENGQKDDSLKHWQFAAFDNGILISDNCRKEYRKQIFLQKKYGAPFGNEFYQYCLEHGLLNDNIPGDDDIINLKRELDRIINSRSWKLTAPLRKLKKVIKGE